MSKTKRALEIQELTTQASVVLEEAAQQTEELLAQVPDGAFEVKHDADLFKGKNAPSECQIAEDTLNLLNRLVAIADEQPHQRNESLNVPDFKKMGAENILMQAKNAVKTLEQGQLQFVQKCQQELRELDSEISRLKMLTAAIEERKTKGDDFGDLGKLKPITQDESEQMIALLKRHHKKYEGELSELCDALFDDENMKATIAVLYRASFQSQEDPYIKINRDNMKYILKLRAYHIVEDHPHNAGKVRLVNPD